MLTLPLHRAGDAGRAATYTIAPRKIIGIGRNYRAHAAEMGAEPPAEPLLFLKAASALVGPDTPIRRPRGYERVDFEGELGVIIGRPARRVSVEAALDHVLGYTCVNDVTVRDLQQRDGQWARAKSFDTFCPVGPWAVSGLDPSDLQLTTRVNGEVRQEARTSSLIFSVAELIAFISQQMTLDAGDLIATGTPSGVGNLVAGDRVEVEIEGIGVLVSDVIDDD